MPRALKVCSEHGCTILTSSSRCPQHSTAWKGSDRRARLPRDWQRTRQRILRRDPICKACGTSPSTDVDHMAAGDNHDDSNLQGLCKGCHARKSSAEGRAARA